MASDARIELRIGLMLFLTVICLCWVASARWLNDIRSEGIFQV